MSVGDLIIIRLREAMEDHQRRTGERMTYEKLAQRTGLAKATLESIGARASYNASLKTIDKICVALDCVPSFLLEFLDDSTANSAKGKRGK